VRLGALASLARRFALVYSYNVNRAVPPRDPIMRLAYRRVRLTIFRTHTGEREVLADAPFMGRPPRRVIHEAVDVALFRPDAAAGRAFRARHGLGGRPVVAVASGALPEVVGGAGVLAPPHDPAAFAAAVRDLLADPGRAAAIGAAARDRALTAFSMERMGREYSEALEGLGVGGSPLS